MAYRESMLRCDWCLGSIGDDEKATCWKCHEGMEARIKELEKILSDAPTVKHLVDLEAKIEKLSYQAKQRTVQVQALKAQAKELEEQNHMLSAEIGGIINSPDCSEECVSMEGLKMEHKKLKAVMTATSSRLRVWLKTWKCHLPENAIIIHQKIDVACCENPEQALSALDDGKEE